MTLSSRETIQLLIALALLLTVAHSLGQLFVRFRHPRVIGEIVGGLLLGPTFLSSIFPGVWGWLFPATGPVPAVLATISFVGLSLLMYASGVQLRSFSNRGERRVVGMLSVSGTVFPFFAGLGLMAAIENRNFKGSANNTTALFLVFAVAIAVTSIPVISRIMLDLKILDTAFARIVLSTAIIEDIVLYVVLAVALGLVQAQTHTAFGLPALIGVDPLGPWNPVYHLLTTVIFLGASLLFGPRLLLLALRVRSTLLEKDDSTGFQLAFLFTMTGLCVLLGIAPLFGALVAGMAVGRVSNRPVTEAREGIELLSFGFFIPIYFAMIGFRLNLIRDFDLTFFLWFLTFACVVKALSIYIGARAVGETHASALNLSVALNARGGPGIVLASVSFDAGIINEGFFSILVVVAVVTSSMAGAWLGYVARRGMNFHP